MSAGQGHIPSQSGTLRPGVDTSLAPPRPVSQRLQHNIPHRFITGINSRAVKCAVCLGTVSFVKPAAKCQGKMLVAYNNTIYIYYLKCDLLVYSCVQWRNMLYACVGL